MNKALKSIRNVFLVAAIFVPHAVSVGAALSEVSPEWKAHFNTNLIVENCVFERFVFSSGKQTNLYQVRYQDNAFLMREIGSQSEITLDQIPGRGMYAGRIGSDYWAIEGGRVLKMFPNSESLINKFEIPDVSLIEAPRSTFLGALFFGFYLLDPKSVQWSGDKSFVGHSFSGIRLHGEIKEIVQGLPTKIEWGWGPGNVMRFETKLNYSTNLDVAYYPSEISIRAFSKGAPVPVLYYRILFLQKSSEPLSDTHFVPTRYFAQSSTSQVIVFTNNQVYGQASGGIYEKIRQYPGDVESSASAQLRKPIGRGAIFAFFLLSVISLLLIWKNRKN